MERKIIEINGILDDWGWLRSNVRYMLNKHKNSPVLCVVNSFGGSINEGLAISKLFEDHGDVVVRFVGCCASAATWMAFGAKEVEMAEDAFFLVHQCSNLVSIYKSMKIEDIEATIKKLENMKKSQEAFNLIIAKKYADRLPEGKTLDDVFALMAEERWMTADETKEWGFVDKVIPGVNKMGKDTQNLVAMNCASLNLPVPHFKQVEQEDNQPIVQAIINGIKNVLMPKKKEDAVDVDNPALSVNNPALSENNPASSDEGQEGKSINNQSVMNKKFLNLIALLAIASDQQTEDTGSVTLTFDQLQTIENALATGKAQEQVVKDVEVILDGVSENVKKMEGVKNKALALVNLVENFPVQAPAGNIIPKGESDAKKEALKASAKDPINEEAQNLYGKGK